VVGVAHETFNCVVVVDVLTDGFHVMEVPLMTGTSVVIMVVPSVVTIVLTIVVDVVVASVAIVVVVLVASVVDASVVGASVVSVSVGDACWQTTTQEDLPRPIGCVLK